MARHNNTIGILISRDDAARTGMTRYRTGVPCKRGHIVDRFVSTGGCVECVQPTRRVHGTDERFWQPPPLLIPGAFKPEHQVELERLVYGWMNVKLREWGYLK